MFCVSGTVTGKYTKHCEKNVHVGNVSVYQDIDSD
jgi:hypothetical protein